ncbi:hypothetical protein Scep_025935 [Stephania cephalantha]|uniref:Late embryogenesis abundant protein LEA-2 subgroup domain-containing protein n=1 Tax=Stephania cephalantha TaxID=152367 RepID=A0AAP0EJ68_9MAGN
MSKKLWIILFIIIVTTISGFVVFHVKDPQILISRARILNIKYMNGSNIPDPSANITIEVDVSIKNPNLASFQYEDGSTTLSYHDINIGEAKTPGGIAKGRCTRRVHLILKFVMEKLFLDEAFSSDIKSGIVIINGYTYFEGRVKAFGAFIKHVYLGVDCEIMVNITSIQVHDQSCRQGISL